MADPPRTLAAARGLLLRTDPARFVALRTELAAGVGDPALATAIRALRKPTTAAWVVNRLVADRPDTVTELGELGTRLRDAQARLEPGRMRELAVRRRALITELAETALEGARRSDAGAGLREEVAATLDAALADPAVLARLGSLQRAERWSGFGFAADGPTLTVVPHSPPSGDRLAGDGGPESGASTHREKPPAHPRRDRRVVRDARRRLEAADRELEDAEQAREAVAKRIRRLELRLSDLSAELEQARAQLPDVRGDARRASAARRRARATLDKLLDQQ